MPAARFMPHEDVADPRVHERVVGGQVGTTGIAEYDVDAFGLEAFHDGVDGTHHPGSAPSTRREGGQRTESSFAAAPRIPARSPPRGTRDRCRSACTSRRAA